MNFLELLDKVDLFARIEPEQLPVLLNCLGATSRSYPKQATIADAGDPVSWVGILCRGQARVIKNDILGNQSVISALDAGDLFGETFACAQVESWPVSVQAVSPCEVLFVDYRRIITTCPSSCPFHLRLIENMLGVLARKSLAQNSKIRIMSARGLRAKLKAFFLEQAVQNDDKNFVIPFSRQELADYLAVERSALSRELSKMREEGLLDFKRNRFTLLDSGWN